MESSEETNRKDYGRNLMNELRRQFIGDVRGVSKSSALRSPVGDDQVSSCTMRKRSYISQCAAYDNSSHGICETNQSIQQERQRIGEEYSKTLQRIFLENKLTRRSRHLRICIILIIPRIHLALLTVCIKQDPVHVLL